MYRLHIAGLTTAIVLTLSIGCSRQAVSDDSLANDIKGKLYSDATTKAANINVAVKDGVVTLSGDVPSSDVELEAMKVVNGTAGVKSVTDQLQVNGATAAAQPPAANPAPPTGSPYPAQPQPTEHRGAEEHRGDRAAAGLTVPAGTRVTVRMIDAIDSRKNTAGQTFHASLDAPLTAGDRVAIPAGADATVLLDSAKSAGRVRGNAGLEVTLTGIDYQGRHYDVSSGPVTEAGKSRAKQTAIRTGVGAAAGAVIGALAGGGKGAAIGAGAGGGAGIGYDIFTHGDQVKIPSETVLTFSLQNALTVSRMRTNPQ